MNFLKEMLSSRQSASFGRVGACTIVTVWLALCSYLTIKTEKVVDMPIQWAGLAGILFGITKLPEMVTPVKKEVPE